LQNRTAELESAQSETALLRERIQQLELTCAQTEVAKNEAEWMRQTLQAELGNVHIVLEQKEASLAQQETNLRESKERLHTQLSNLQNQLAEKTATPGSKRWRNWRHALAEIAVLEERIIQLESLHNEVQATAASEVERIAPGISIRTGSMAGESPRKGRGRPTTPSCDRSIGGES